MAYFLSLDARVTKISFLPTISMHHQEKNLQELIKESPKEEIKNLLNFFFSEKYESHLENLYADGYTCSLVINLNSNNLN